jgi:hypothetical protein
MLFPLPPLHPLPRIPIHLYSFPVLLLVKLKMCLCRKENEGKVGQTRNKHKERREFTKEQNREKKEK